jgi:hypothetical protein
MNGLLNELQEKEVDNIYNHLSKSCKKSVKRSDIRKALNQAKDRMVNLLLFGTTYPNVGVSFRMTCEDSIDQVNKNKKEIMYKAWKNTGNTIKYCRGE